MSHDSIVGGQYRDGRNLEARVRLHEHFSNNPLGLHPWLLGQIDLPEQADVLELGCGVGSFWVTNRDRIPSGWRVTLTDASTGMVREAEHRLCSHPLRFTFVTVNAEDLPYPDSAFDAVFAHFMLYHVEDRPRAMREIVRVLRSGGQLYAATNGARHMHEARVLALQAGLMTTADMEAGDAAGFRLDNGAAQLEAEFSDVSLRRYEDGLVVTDAEPLLAYILSSSQVQTMLARLEPVDRERRIATLRSLIDDRLVADGQIRVTKDSGLFIARRP